MLAALPEGKRPGEGVDDVGLGLGGAVVAGELVGEDEDVAGEAEDEHVEPAVAGDHGAGEAHEGRAGLVADDAGETRRGEREGTDDVDGRVGDHHVGGLLGLGGFGGVEVVLLDASSDGVEEGCVDEDCAEFGEEDPDVVRPEAELRVFGVDPAL